MDEICILRCGEGSPQNANAQLNKVQEEVVVRRLDLRGTTDTCLPEQLALDGDNNDVD